MPQESSITAAAHDDQALLLAAGNGDLERLNDLLAPGPAPALNLDARTPDGRTPLMLAASGGHAAVVDRLLPVSDPDVTDANGWTALLYAAHENRAEVVRRLLPVSDVNAPDREGFTALLHAVQDNLAGLFDLLMEQPDLNVVHPNQRGVDALGFAVMRNRVPMARRLIERDASLLTTLHPTPLGAGMTALMRAVDQAEINTALLDLLLPGSDPLQTNPRGMSAWSIALRNASKGILATGTFQALDRMALYVPDNDATQAMEAFPGQLPRLTALRERRVLHATLDAMKGPTVADDARPIASSTASLARSRPRL